MNWGGNRKGAGRKNLPESQKKKGYNLYITCEIKDDIETFGIGKTFSEKVLNLIVKELEIRKKRSNK